MLYITEKETRFMTKEEIDSELVKRIKALEEFGMSREDAYEFVSGIKNLGMAEYNKIVEYEYFGKPEKELEIMDFLLEEE